MTDSAELIRSFFTTWPRSDVDELVGYFSDDAVYTDGPRGSHRGIDAIRAEFQSTTQLVPSTTVDVKNLVADGGTVLVERVDIFEMQGTLWKSRSSGCSKSTTG